MSESAPDASVTGTDPSASAGDSPRPCPNCGAPRKDRFCAKCGQNDRDYMRGFWLVAWEFVKETAELDSKVFRSLASLFFKPGSLSKEFTQNRRASFTSPVRLYLAASLVFFLVLSASAGRWWSSAVQQIELADEFVAAADGNLPDSIGEVLSRRTGGSFEVSAPAGSRASEEEQLDSAKLAALKARLSPERIQKVDDILNRPGASVAKMVVDGALLDELPDLGEQQSGLLEWFYEHWVRIVIDLFHSPQDFLQEAIENLPVAMFCLLPIFALILALCHLRKKRYFVAHLVFGMHVHSFAFLTLAAAMLLPGGVIGSWLKVLLITLIPVYVLIALRRFYEESWISTLIKGCIAWGLYSFVLFPGLMLASFVRM